MQPPLSPITIHYMAILIVFGFGLCVGSFLNVCIYRIPAGVSIVSPRSRCPRCHTQLRFYENIPLVSFLLQGARCRTCKTRISFRYPMVEALTGLTAVAAVLQFGPTLAGLIYFIFLCALIVISFIDLDHQIIPDVITLPGIPLALLASSGLPSMTILDSLIGIAAGGGSLYAVAVTYRWIKHQDGMGGGDIKLLAVIGGIIGWQGVIFTVFVGSAVGTVAGVAIMLYSRFFDTRLKIPFGPFLSIGATVYLFYGPPLITWYFHLLRGRP